jgi:hypothetical protein
LPTTLCVKYHGDRREDREKKEIPGSRHHFATARTLGTAVATNVKIVSFGAGPAERPNVTAEALL